MQTQDIFVGTVAAAIGLVLLTGAATGANWLMQLRRARFLVDSLGERGARILLGAIGIGSITLGVAIALGWRLNWF